MQPSADADADRPPGPDGLPLLGNTLEFGRHTFEFLQRGRREYGDVVAFEVLGREFYQLNHPAHVRRVLVEESANYRKASFLTDQFGEFLGEGLLLSEGETWRRGRRLVRPAFDPERVAAHAETMVDRTERVLNAWEPGERLDLGEETTRLALEIVTDALFGVDLRAAGPTLRRSFRIVTREFRDRTARPVPVPSWVPTPRNRRYRRARRRIDAAVAEIVERRRANPGDDVVSALVRASADADADRLDAERIRDHAVTLLFAGHETTAVALTFAFHLLATHPHAEAAAVAELRDALGDRRPTAADARSLDYLGKVVKETLRLYPPVFGVLREPIADDEIGGYRVPAGSTVAMNQITLHRDPRFFADPEAFDPGRWTPSFEADLPEFAYFPFGAGLRRCLGERFATLETTLVLATVLRRYHLELASDRDLVLEPSVTTRPRDPVAVRPKPR